MTTLLPTLATAGFDIAHAFDAAVVAREPGLEGLGAGLGILVGNTRTLWPRFGAALRADATLAADPDPLDRYTERTLEAAAPGARGYFAHRRYAGAYLPFQRLAVASGLGALAPSQLVIHPIYGPWFALRAVILVDRATPPPPTAPIGLPADCACVAAPADASWQQLLAARSACAIGRTWRYPDDQARYHYTKDRAILRDLAAR